MIVLLAAVLLRWPALLEQLDAEHVLDAAGCCVACPPHDGEPGDPVAGSGCLLRPALVLAKRLRAVNARTDAAT